MGYRIIDTTADIGIEVWAEDFKSLLEEAVRGMVSLMYDLKKIKGEKELEIEVEGIDREDLLISLLNEIIYLRDAEKFLAKEIEVKEATENRVKAILRGDTFNPDAHEIVEEIKAATFHNIEIKEEGGVLKSRIIFDV
ncbi:MAG: archease [Deferribacteres bacterium]|nr:archease [Deferribacteres bacterium]